VEFAVPLQGTGLSLRQNPGYLKNGTLGYLALSLWDKNGLGYLGWYLVEKGQKHCELRVRKPHFSQLFVFCWPGPFSPSPPAR